MRQFLLALLFFLPGPSAIAWNAAGHRLTATIAWQQLSPTSRDGIASALRDHPDSPRWAARARSEDGLDLFAEAATWPDDIRNDPRFYDEARESPTSSVPGLPDTARHKDWHYTDLDHRGAVVAGQLGRQIEHQSRLLRSTRKKGEISYFLPWLTHLVADAHQPLHVGRHGDEGGNQVEIENPFNKRLPFSSLHLYWDDLPGPPWLRGARLRKIAMYLMETYPAPVQGDVDLWLNESHRLLDQAYPQTAGSLLPVITEDFHEQNRELSNRQIVAAGYRLGRLLDEIFRARVPRETP